ncbi:hypothetical protein [Actinomycetospora sp. CA-053990]|uniref:hypothetical protein n=1 Tax=Actinomycetospora sp. CA-053990 TaxID=3239891 RepID=UPI003D8D9E0F
MIVGALVTGALALGAGVAGAAEDGAPCHVLLREGVVEGDKCVTPGGTVLGSLVDAILGPVVAPPTSSAPAESPAGGGTSSPGVVPGAVDTVSDLVDGVTGNTPAAGGSGGTSTSTTGADNGTSASSGSGTASDAPASTGGPAQAVVQPPSGVQAPDVRAGLLTPAVSAPGGLAARVPALGFGTVDPRLLMVPTGSPLRTLTGVTPGSPVTTSSDVQAMALDGLPSGLGTPAVLGVLILSTLAGFALRHRVLRRVRLAAAPKPEPAT